MPRYIDADERDAHIEEMMNAVSKHKYGNMNEWDCLNWMRDIIDSAPTVDAVPVVRCKDCKHSYRVTAYRTNDGKDITMLECDLDGYTTASDWFCAEGERKDGGKDAD